MASVQANPGETWERAGRRRDVVRVVEGNRFTSAAIEWRRPGDEDRKLSCSLSAWVKWESGAHRVAIGVNKDGLS